MLGFIKNKFAFIIAISLLTLILLVAGAVILYQDKSKTFKNEGYIISTTTKKNNKYYFSPNTKYKSNVDNDIVFKDSDSKKVTVSSENFVHYQNGSLAFLTKGAILNLNEINSSAMNYYNVDNDDIITYKNNNYVVQSNKGDVNIESLIGRISDNKYIIAGKNLSLKIPNNNELITGDYFEILYIENGIVKIDNQEVSYQVTAQDSTIYIGDNKSIDLGTGKIFYNGEAKMLMSQLTINGDENIDINTVEDENKDDKAGSGSGIGEDNSGTGENGTKIPEENNENGTNNTKENENGKDGTGGSGNGGTVKTTAQIELIEASVTSTSIDLSFQLNNASAIKGKLTAILTNVNNNKREIEKEIESKNGTFKLNKESLLPDTEYTLTITEVNDKSEKQYFQKTFKTNDLGITLEKEYATSSSLAYTIKYDENSDVDKVKLAIFNSEGVRKEGKEFIISKEDISKTREFSELTSNTNYSVKVESVWIRNIEYSDVYTINRIDTTLKQTPILSDIKITPNAEEVKFNIKVNSVTDPDKSIVSYKYNIYKVEDITLDNPNPEPVYTITKNDSDDLVLNLNEIEELKTGVDYRCKAIALYDDNTMIREAPSDYSVNFLIKSKPNITWTTESTSINRVSGILKLLDGNCSVPINGRKCLNKANNFTIRYYKLGEDESTGVERNITIDGNDLTTNITINELSSNTTYALKLYGNYVDDNNEEHKNVQIGDIIYFKTDVSENLKFKVIKDNQSGVEEGNNNIRTAPVVTFDAKLEAPKDSTISDEVSSITFNLYSGSYNVENKLIGTYVMNKKADIKDFFNNFTITNKLFTNERIGLINTVDKLITLTNNQSGTLNGTYTVEVVDVMDSAGVNKIYVEDNVYTFKLTPAYYLDVRINTNTSQKYITVTPIKKQSLTTEEHDKLITTVKNLDDLNDDTIVGIIVENTLSDTYVDSAYDYEKVIVDYVIYNNTTSKETKRISIDMGNKYQPKSQTIYLDPTELDNGENNFTRGYNYKISYELNFTTEKGDNPTYKNNNLSENLVIKRQSAIYSQYISTSTNNNITYRFKITDIDNSLYNKNLYYDYKNDTEKKQSEEELILDGEFHDITLPIDKKEEYKIYFKEKSTNNNVEAFKEITKYTFEGEYNYNDDNAFEIVNDYDNTLKIKILENDVTKRAIAYKLTIKEKNGALNDVERYFLASKLTTKNIETGELDEDGNPITKKEKYISLDYAQIYEYMKHDLVISLESYYDSGLVGFNQQIPNGMILYNEKNYLNVFSVNGGGTTESNEALGIYKYKNTHQIDSESLEVYNTLQLTNNNTYNEYNGLALYTNNISEQLGTNFVVTYTNAGAILNNNKKQFTGYNTKVLKNSILKANNYNYKFDSITPKVSITSNNTINSIKVKIDSTGVYGQFIKNNQEHNIFYIDVYSSSELTTESHLATLTSNITINDKTATSEQVELKNLDPNTTYYVTVSAYIEGVLTRLYDKNSTKGYVLKTYESRTLNAREIVPRFEFSVSPKSYNNESSNKELKWKIYAQNTENYKIRFELYDKNDNPVKFDGREGTNCDKNINGTEANGYVANCYIQAPKEEIENIKGKDQIYMFTGDNFVFGDGYYKMKLYAIPYKNNRYDEDKKVTLFETDSLSNSKDKITEGMSMSTISIKKLEEPTFSLNDLTSGTRCVTIKDSEGYAIYDSGKITCDPTAPQNSVEYYIEFSPGVTDNDKVIKYGTYTIKLKNSSNETLITKTQPVTEQPQQISFSNLNSNTLYYVELDYETYRNNVGFDENQKIATVPFTDFIYTPIDSGITLGTITATQNSNKLVTLTYNGAYNMLNNIKKVSYTISLKGGSSNASGKYEINTETPNIFTVSADKTPKLSINLEESSDTNFTFKGGNTYIINTKYWYILYKGGIYEEEKKRNLKEEDISYLNINGQECLVNPEITSYNNDVERCYWPLKDQNTGNDIYTTILNL